MTLKSKITLRGVKYKAKRCAQTELFYIIYAYKMRHYFTRKAGRGSRVFKWRQMKDTNAFTIISIISRSMMAQAIINTNDDSVCYLHAQLHQNHSGCCYIPLRHRFLRPTVTNLFSISLTLISSVACSQFHS